MLAKSNTYLDHLDGLRAIAVVAVFLFHVGWLPYGYLGVDLFFVLSGFLIVRNVMSRPAFSLRDYSLFLVRRLRRLAPALCLVMAVALCFGLYAMLPDDLENLGQSIVASSLYANNYLLFATTRDYWDTINEFKPLLHTWSLGIEMQFYTTIPLLLVLLPKRYFTIAIVTVTLSSLCYSILMEDPDWRFYSIFSRIYQFGLGAGVAILLREPSRIQKSIWLTTVAFGALLVFFSVKIFSPNDPVLGFLATLMTALFLLFYPSKSTWLDHLLNSRLASHLGKISYSFYLWHFILIVAVKYLWVHDLRWIEVIGLFVVTYGLSAWSYRYIETPFRDRKLVPDFRFMVLFVSASLFLIACGALLHIRSGVVRAVPELDIAGENVDAGLHSKYNASILPDTSIAGKDFKGVRVLLIGDSFARDFANVLKESDVAHFELRYCPLEWMPYLSQINASFDYVFIGLHATADNPLLDKSNLRQEWLDDSRVHVVGSKSFGKNMGIVYNNLRSGPYCQQLNDLDYSYVSENTRLAKVYGDQFIDMLSPVLVGERVSVFTPDCKFISQDGRHLTKAGAQYYATLLPLEEIFRNTHD